MMISTSTNSSQMRLLYRRAVWKNIDVSRLIADEIDKDVLTNMRKLIDKDEGSANDDRN